MTTNNKTTENKTNQKATICGGETFYNHDEFCIKSILYAVKPDGTEIKKTIVSDMTRDEFKKRAIAKWSNTTLCNFLKITPEDLSLKIPYQPNYDVRIKHTKSLVSADKETLLNFIDVRVWSKVRKYFVDFKIDTAQPFPFSKQSEILSIDNLAGYENV